MDLVIEPIDIDKIASKCQIVFLSLPNNLAYTMAPQLIEKGCKVLDLSADYRFSNLDIYKKWYGGERTDQAIAATAVYGLPELYRDRLATAQLVGCAGCYVTASLLAISPLLKQGLVDPHTTIIDAKSGTSGGGRQAKVNMLLAEADSSIGAYSVGGHHRHTPEIEQVCSDLAGHDILVQFTPHLMPMVRGILATVYATLRDPGLVREDLITIYKAFYRNSPLVKILPGGTYPQTKWACGTNLCYLGIEVDQRTGRVIVMSAIDNLIRQEIGATQSPYSLVSRLFRNHPQICFSRPYHAMVDDSVTELIRQKPQWQIVTLPQVSILTGKNSHGELLSRTSNGWICC